MQKKRWTRTLLTVLVTIVVVISAEITTVHDLGAATTKSSGATASAATALGASIVTIAESQDQNGVRR